MYPRANIIIFGLWDGYPGGIDGCSRKDGPIETMGAQFNRLVRFIRQSDVAQDADISFIDLMVDNPGSYRKIIDDMLDRGYKLPFIVINDRMRFTGNINIRNIYNEIKIITENGCMFC